MDKKEGCQLTPFNIVYIIYYFFLYLNIFVYFKKYVFLEKNKTGTNMTVIEVCENGCLLENDSANKSCPKCNAAIIFSKELEDSDDKNYYVQIKAQTLNEAKTIALEKLENNPNAVASQIKIQQQLIESLADIFRNELKKLGSGIDSLSNLLNSLKSADYEKNKEKLSIDDILKRNSEINNKNV